MQRCIHFTPIRSSLFIVYVLLFFLFFYFVFSAQDASEMLDQILRILMTEVGGYSIKHMWNPLFTTQLPRCVAQKFNFHSEIWRTGTHNAQHQLDTRSLCDPLWASDIVSVHLIFVVVVVVRLFRRVLEYCFQ